MEDLSPSRPEQLQNVGLFCLFDMVHHPKDLAVNMDHGENLSIINLKRELETKILIITWQRHQHYWDFGVHTLPFIVVQTVQLSVSWGH